jgi:PAT family beta-lactamase induction signal transducer AmpG
MDYFKRDGAWWILGFILLYKLGDNMADAMATPFYLDVGYTKTEIASISKVFGWIAIVAGGLAGGGLVLRWGINRCLYVFGVLQALACVGFAVVAVFPKSLPILAGAIGFENIAIGMGTSAYSAYMASLTNKKFTATQYALLTSLMGIPGSILSAPTGYLAKAMGWPMFFTFCALMAIPGMLLLFRIAPWSPKRSAGFKTATAELP